MKENSKSIKWLLILSISCFVLDIVFFVLANIKIYDCKTQWLEYLFIYLADICLALFTGALVSLIIACLNYKNALKQNTEKLSFLFYKVNSKLFSVLFNENKEINLKTAYNFISTYDECSSELYTIINELSDSLILHYKKFQEKIDSFKSRFEKEYNLFSQFNFYLEKQPKHFKPNSVLVYYYWDNILASSVLYHESLEISRLFGGAVYSPEEFLDKEKLKIELANLFKRKIERLKIKQTPPYLPFRCGDSSIVLAKINARNYRLKFKNQIEVR